MVWLTVAGAPRALEAAGCRGTSSAWGSRPGAGAHVTGHITRMVEQAPRGCGGAGRRGLEHPVRSTPLGAGKVGSVPDLGQCE